MHFPAVFHKGLCQHARHYWPFLEQGNWGREGPTRRSKAGCQASECQGSSQPHAWTSWPSLAPQWEPNAPALLLHAAGARRWVPSGWRLLALRQGGSQQGKTRMVLVSDTIICGIMGLSWTYPRRNAILDWVTCVVRLTADGKWRSTVNLCVVSLSGCIAGESQYFSGANALPPCPSSWLWSSHL